MAPIPPHEEPEGDSKSRSPLGRSTTRSVAWYGSLLLIMLILLAYSALVLRPSVRGDGSFQQVVIVESPREVRRLLYVYGIASEEAQQRAVQSADPRWIESPREAKVLGQNRFEMKVWTAFEANSLWVTSESYQKHFTVYVDFAHGPPECRVIDIPEGYGSEPVLMRFP